MRWRECQKEDIVFSLQQQHKDHNIIELNVVEHMLQIHKQGRRDG